MQSLLLGAAFNPRRKLREGHHCPVLPPSYLKHSIYTLGYAINNKGTVLCLLTVAASMIQIQLAVPVHSHPTTSSDHTRIFRSDRLRARRKRNSANKNASPTPYPSSLSSPTHFRPRFSSKPILAAFDLDFNNSLTHLHLSNNASGVPMVSYDDNF